MNPDADFFAILHEGAAHLDRRALLDVLQNLRVAGFEADNQQTRAAIGHGFQSFVIAVHASGAGPLESHGFEFLAQRDDAILADVEGVVIEEKFLGLRKHFVRLLEFAGHIFHGTHAPGVAGKRLRPEAEGAERRTAARGVKRNVRDSAGTAHCNFRWSDSFGRLRWPSGSASSSAVCSIARGGLCTTFPS